jgi:hypothetical protein
MGADCAVHIIKFLAAHSVTHVTDPFCGKGTVLAAANAFGISAQGVDVSAKQGASVAVATVRSKPHDLFAVKDSQRVVLFGLPPTPPPSFISRFDAYSHFSPSDSHVQALRRAGGRNSRFEYPGAVGVLRRQGMRTAINRKFW